MSVLYLITARGGSKGVPGKNLRKIGGHSLIAWKARAAKQVISDEDRLVISTDCPRGVTNLKTFMISLASSNLRAQVLHLAVVWVDHPQNPQSH